MNLYQISIVDDSHIPSSEIWDASYCDNPNDPWFGRLHVDDPIAKFYVIPEEKLIAKFVSSDSESSDEEFDLDDGFIYSGDDETKEENLVDFSEILKKTMKFKSKNFKGIQHFNK